MIRSYATRGSFSWDFIENYNQITQSSWWFFEYENNSTELNELLLFMTQIQVQLVSDWIGFKSLTWLVNMISQVDRSLNERRTQLVAD